MKGISIVLLLSFVIQSKSFGQDTIFWRPDYKLTWDDFKGGNNTASPFKAYTSTRIDFFMPSMQPDALVFTVRCYFLAKKSWTMDSSVYLLAHEQIHFDITELYARKLRFEFKKYIYNAATVNKDIDSIFKKVHEELVITNEKYDIDTKHSTDADQQAVWAKEIERALEGLNDYKE